MLPWLIIGSHKLNYIFIPVQDLVHLEEKHQTFQPEKPLTIINVNLINTNLSTKEPKLSSFSSLQETPRSPPAVLHRPPADVQAAGSYAAQQQIPHLQQLPSSAPESQQDSLCDDYGFVHHVENVSGATNSLPAAEENQYRAQASPREAGWQSCEEEITEEDEGVEEKEGEISTFLNWDPETRVLKIPLLCQLDSEHGTETDMVSKEEPEVNVDTNLLLRHPVLTSVVFRQSSEDSGEEDAFIKMEMDWGLRIN